MAELTPQRPFPPGSYPVVVVGSGPGGLQVSHSLSHLGIRHAALSSDPAPGGMFRRWPLFQRLLSWTKPHAPEERSTRYYQKYDWNSLIDEGGAPPLQPSFLDGSSYFPSRPEIEQGLVAFAERAEIQVRYGCRWESTRRDEAGGFVLVTSDGEYRARVLVVAVGVAEPWRPPTPGMELVPHYGESKSAEAYAGRRLFIVGKQNSGFEIASGLLPWARQIILASPSRTRLSVETRSLVGVRARYVQPWEDFVLGGGVLVLNAAIDAVRRSGQGFRVETRRAEDSLAMSFEVDDVIAATGFTAPLRDLPDLGVATFGQSRLPAQTPFWESATVPGIYFAGTISQGSHGLRKHGLPSNSGAIHGHRYNARVLAGHIARSHFNAPPETAPIAAGELLPYLLREVTRGPELWHQKSYLARVVDIGTLGPVDAGIQPLASYVDGEGPDGLAITLEANTAGDIYPVVYLRRRGSVTERVLSGHPALDFETAEHRAEMAAVLGDLMGDRAPTAGSL